MQNSNWPGLPEKLKTEQINIKKGFTHGAKFHSDDVFATALLRILNPEIEILRGFEVPEGFEGIVYDIGRGRFDHHQEDKAVRDNGVPYAAFGLLWREFGSLLIGEDEAQRYDEKVIQDMDLSDNTGSDNLLAKVISEFNPGWDSKESQDDAFWRAEAFAEEILKNHIRSVQGIQRGRKIVLEAMQEGDGTVLILPQFVPWKDAVIGSGYRFVIYPSNRGGYSVQGVPVGYDTQDLVCRLPQAWWGQDTARLVELTGIATIRFCHNTGFLASAGTLEDAIQITRLALQS